MSSFSVNPASRCFQGLANSESKNSSDYITRKRQKTLYKNQRNAVTTGNYSQAKAGIAYNPVQIQPCGKKLNGSIASMHSNTLQHSGKVAAADSYAMLLDLAKGKHLVNPRFAGAESAKFGSWLSQMMAINYNGPQNTGPLSISRLGSMGTGPLHSIPIGGLSTEPQNASGYSGLEVDSSLNNCMTFPLPAAANTFTTSTYGTDASWNPSAYPGYILDPNKNILYRDTCAKMNGQGIGFWARLATPAFTNQPAYWKAVNAQPLNGFDKSDLGSISLTDDLVDAKTNFVIQAFGPGMTPQTTNLNPPPDISGCLDAEIVRNVQSIYNHEWDKYAWQDMAPYGRVSGFQPGCARIQACRGFSKLN